MRCTRFWVVVVMGLGAAVPASAQDFHIVARASTQSTTATADDVIARLMSFDRDRDGKVQKAELIDRMQPIVATGDTDGDGALDGLEIRAMALSARTAAARTVPFGGGSYRIPDPGFFSSRAHIEGLVADLKLRDDAHRRALEIVAAHDERVKAAEDGAFGELRYDLVTVLTPQQLSSVEAAARRQHGTFTIHQRTALEGSVRRVFLGMGSRVSDVVDRLALSPATMQQARAATERYEATVTRRRAEEKARLLEQLGAVMGAEELESFRASLDRQSAVPLNPVMDGDVVVRGTVSGIVVGGTVGRPVPRVATSAEVTAVVAAPTPPPPNLETAARRPVDIDR